jgi:hypothetical protein
MQQVSSFHTPNIRTEEYTGMTIQKRWLLSALMFASFTFATAQAKPSQQHNSQNHSGSAQTADQKNQAGALLEAVREATERFKDVEQAKKAGYALVLGCVSGPDSGAMGLHFLNGDLLNEVNTNGVFYASRPQIVIYEPTSDGSLRITGADFIVFADAWNAKHPEGPPQLMGQLFHLFEFPNRFGLPAFYTLHVWAWKENPNGAFVNWHPDVSCQSFAGKTP